MNKRLEAELWEIQAILYLILAQLVETNWIMWAIRIWAVITLAHVLYWLAQDKEVD